MRYKTLILLVCIAAAISTKVSAQPLTDDIKTVVLWHMDETTQPGSRLVIPDDNSVSGRTAMNLTLGDNSNTPGTQPVLTTDNGGMFGEALMFDSSTAQMALQTNAWQGYQDFKIEFWFKQDADAQGDQTVLSAKEGSVWELRLSPSEEVDLLRLYLWYDGAVVSVSREYTKGVWNKVVAIVSAENGFMSLSIEDDEISRAIDGVSDGTGRIYAGCKQTGNRNYDGLLDEVKISTLTFPEYMYTYEDAYGTFMLWHNDELFDSDDKLYVADDDSANPDRGYDLIMLHNGGAARPGEGTGPQIVPSTLNVDSGEDFGNALYYNGLNDSSRVNIFGDNLGVDGSNFRFEAWVKLDENINTYGAGKQYYIGYHPSRFALYLTDSSSGWKITWSNWWDGGAHGMVRDYPNHTQWHHVAGDFYEGRRRLYLDGEIIYDRPAQYAGSVVLDAAGYLYVGAKAATDSLFYGMIDEVRISQAEPTDAPCGYWGYHQADLNKDCYVDILDLKMMVGNWLKCSLPDDPDCEQFN